jgi:transposase
MPTDPLIATHPERREIDRMIIEGVSNREIARTHKISEKAVRTYIRSTFAEGIVRAAKERELQDGMFALNHMMELLEDLKKLRTALIRWLTDPEHPEQLCVDPRAWEIDVIYEEKDENGAIKERRATLQEALNAVDGIVVRETRIMKASDNRQLLLNTIDSTARQLTIWLKTQENARDIHAEIAVTEILAALIPVMMEAADGNPQLRHDIEQALIRVQQKLAEDRGPLARRLDA